MVAYKIKTSEDTFRESQVRKMVRHEKRRKTEFVIQRACGVILIVTGILLSWLSQEASYALLVCLIGLYFLFTKNMELRL